MSPKAFHFSAVPPLLPAALLQSSHQWLHANFVIIFIRQATRLPRIKLPQCPTTVFQLRNNKTNHCFFKKPPAAHPPHSASCSSEARTHFQSIHFFSVNYPSLLLPPLYPTAWTGFITKFHLPAKIIKLMKAEKTEKEQKTLSNDFGSPKLQHNTGEAAWLERGALTKLPGSWPLQDTAWYRANPNHDSVTRWTSSKALPKLTF